MLHDQLLADGNFRFAFEHVAKVRSWLLNANDLRGERLDKAVVDKVAAIVMDAIGSTKQPHPWLRHDAVQKKRGRPPKEKISADNGHGLP